jgi:hypothetical protein
LQHCAYIPSCHRDFIVPCPLLSPFPVCSTYPRLVVRSLGRPRRRWVDNIKIDLREIGWDGGEWIDLAQDRDHWRALVRAVMNLRVP